MFFQKLYIDTKIIFETIWNKEFDWVPEKKQFLPNYEGMSNTCILLWRTSVISERKVWFQHARVWFIYAKCGFHTQSVIFKRRVQFLHAVWCWNAQIRLRCSRLWFQHAQERFLHAECDVDTYECDYDNHESDYDTLTC
jgi:hypothetical protein